MMPRDFHPSPPTVGLELEWQLVHHETLDLHEGIAPLLALLPPDPCIKPEVIEPCVEVVTAPMASTALLRGALLERVSRVSEAAARLGMVLVGAGTHPFCERIVPVTPLPRYLEMQRRSGYLANTQIVYALHVHVGMPSGEVAIRVMAQIRAVLPVLLALSASSPAYCGRETSFASFRRCLLAPTRSAGIAPAFDDWAAFLHFVDVVERAAMFASYRDMHWDLRPRPDLGTLEVRIMDAQPTNADALALGALVHSLLAVVMDDATTDPRLPRAIPWWIEKENGHRAARDGLDAELVVDAEGHSRALRRMAEDLFDITRPKARALGEEADLARAEGLLSRGNSSMRQMDVLRRTGSMKAVARALADELRAEIDLCGRYGAPAATA
ncbi:carboxylate-amine ligase [Polyangium mundeleinium]|uniref:Putative glutamate--cysteine ligase 2 n=1 Tax=Polyangium mundeleinium TaxID=2995306 RepID=A0ABT5ETD8_9BACT|nr:YbdK family carboxylate-amine ligase [Polyangium mundeleinium]MDC0744729.1 YbdK family carboxylate-amine ligase [Polyangium mundeleinium]